MSFKNLKLDYTDQGIVKLIFSNPKSKNAFNPKMIMEIKDALKTLDKSNKCKVLIFPTPLKGLLPTVLNKLHECNSKMT